MMIRRLEPYLARESGVTDMVKGQKLGGFISSGNRNDEKSAAE